MAKAKHTHTATQTAHAASLPEKVGIQEEELPPPDGGYAPEADYDDSIAGNRKCALPDPTQLPEPPATYRPTDPDTRRRRLRRLPASLRSEVAAALTDVGARGAAVQTDLGTFAPSGEQAKPLATRMAATGAIVKVARDFYRFATEVDQIATSDGMLFLERVQKQLVNAVEHNPNVASKYESVSVVFDSQSAAIKAGQARAKKAKPAVAATTASAKPKGE